MSSQGPLPYLRFCGVEIANAARTVEYLKNGLANTMQGHWDVAGDGLCGVLYRTNGGTCFAPEVFVSPAADPAPWYDPTEPGSTDFLGLVLLDLTGYDSTLVREVTPRIQGLGGATFSGQRRGPRTWKFRAAMVSASDAGAEFGLRWLTSALESSECATCATCDIAVRLSCPPDDCSDDSVGEWVSYDVVLSEGPLEVEKWAPSVSSLQDTMAGCRDLVTVEWVMTAGNPFLYKPAEVCLGAEVIGVDAPCHDICDFLFGDPGDAHCCEVEPPASGTLGAVFTFNSSSEMGPVLLQAYAECPPAPLPEIAGANKTFKNAVAVASLATDPFTPVNGDLYLAAVWSYMAPGVPNTPTMSSTTGLNWVQVGTIAFNANEARLTLFRALKTSGLGVGTATVDFGGQTQTYVQVWIDEFSGVDTTGVDGSAAVRQSVAASDTGGGVYMFLADFGASTNATYAAWAHMMGEPVDPEADWTELSDIGGGESEWYLGEDPSPTASWATSAAPWGGVAVEIAAPTVAPAPDPVLEMEISGIPANSALVVDCSRRRITLTTADGEEDAENLIDLSEGRTLQWIETRDCDEVFCFCARTAHPCSQGGDTTVEISTQLREG